MPTKEARRVRVLALDDFHDFKIAILEEIDIVAAETKADVADKCNERFDSIKRALEDWIVNHDQWKIGHSADLAENTKLSRQAVDGIADLKLALAGAITIEDGVKKSVGAIGWAGNRLGDLGQWGAKAFGGVIVICVIIAAYQGVLNAHTVWQFISKKWS